MKSFLLQRWFLIALVTVLVIGIHQAEFLAGIADQDWLRDSIVAAVMFCMSLPLTARSVLQSLRTPGPALLAIGITYGILPLAAWLLSGLLRGDLAPGLLVAAATPCTLASAAVWTRRAGGNDAVAILVTILTNSSCFFITPIWLLVMTGKTLGVENSTIGFARMTTQLGLLVVLPIVVAQVLRLRKVVAEIATRRKAEMGVLAQCGILSMVFLGAIKTGLRLQSASGSMALLDAAVMLTTVVVLHVSMLWLGIATARMLGFSREDQIAVGFSGSQKTLMVGLLMAITLKTSILPMVAYHCLQLLVDTLVADTFRRRGEQATPSNESGGELNL